MERVFQKEAYHWLNKDRSVLLVAPTGLGKTRAALQPFVSNINRGGLLGTRLLYSLPLRALTQGVKEEWLSLCPTLKPVIHHGDEPESQYFSERTVITTVDQYFTAFAGAPLSWASHVSHAAAGAVLTSYSVFDEVHLLSPRAGLQLLFAILRLRQRWGLLSCVMTATMPDSAVTFFRDYCGLEFVQASDEDVKERDSWRKVSVQLLGEKRTSTLGGGRRRKQAAASSFAWEEREPQDIAELVRESWGSWSKLKVNGPRKIIVFVNTVDRAIETYKKIKLLNIRPQVVLAHARFTKDDRQRVEERIQQLFGKGTQDSEAILVTTQVAEAGLNISAPLVITELAPIDSLIQRAGRCQRFKPEDWQESREIQGLVLVVKPKAEGKTKWYVPYTDSIFVEREQFPIVEVSRHVLEERFENGEFLNWNVEKALVNDALSEAYRAFLNGLDRLEYTAIESTPLGKTYRQLKQRTPEELETAGEEYGKEETVPEE